MWGATLVAEVLENAFFKCMVRDPLYLAQSLLGARLEMHADPLSPYGVDEPARHWSARKMMGVRAPMARFTVGRVMSRNPAYRLGGVVIGREEVETQRQGERLLLNSVGAVQFGWD